MSALEENNQQILLQKLEIRSLKDQVIRVLEERGSIGAGQNSNNSGNLNGAGANSSGTVGDH